jgi:hypothetical protein
MTAAHEFIGTPAYNEPGAGDARMRDIDTRSDIYGLG